MIFEVHYFSAILIVEIAGGSISVLKAACRFNEGAAVAVCAEAEYQKSQSVSLGTLSFFLSQSRKKFHLI